MRPAHGRNDVGLLLATTLINICYGVIYTLLNEKHLYFVSFCSGFVKNHGILTDFIVKMPFLIKYKTAPPRTEDELICCPGPQVNTFLHRKDYSLKNL
jgi:hypothetical protein